MTSADHTETFPESEYIGTLPQYQVHCSAIEVPSFQRALCARVPKLGFSHFLPQRVSFTLEVYLQKINIVKGACISHFKGCKKCLRNDDINLRYGVGA